MKNHRCHILSKEFRNSFWRPRILEGFTALSVEIVTGYIIFFATVKIEFVPKMLFLTAD